MHRPTRTPIAVVAIALALAFAPAHADAQLGGLVKKAAKAAAAKAVDKKLGGDAEQQGAAGAADDSRPTSESDSLYRIVHPTSADLQPITADLLGQFFRGYAEERGIRNRGRACMQKVWDSAAWKELDDEQPASEAEANKLEARRDAMMRKECGVSQQASDAEEYRMFIAGATAGGLAPRQYAMVRERVLAFAAIANKYNADNYHGYKFSAPERQALEARRADVDQMLRDYRGK